MSVSKASMQSAIPQPSLLAARLRAVSISRKGTTNCNPDHAHRDSVMATRSSTTEKPGDICTDSYPRKAISSKEYSRHDFLCSQAQRAYLAEFMAQAVFNIASCSIVAIAKVLTDLPGPLATAEVMVLHFVLLYVLIGATQPTSGGHFNPMVSAMMAYWGVIPWSWLPGYVLAQILGGTLGSIVQYGLLPPHLQSPAAAGIQAVPPDHSVLQAFVGETAAAFILMFIVASTALDPNGNPKRIPLVMALTVPLLIFCFGPVSSMCINPARALGPAVASGFWENHWVWWTAPFLGGWLAFAPYKRIVRGLPLKKQ